MLESFFYSVNSEYVNRDIIYLFYLYCAELFIWIFILNIIFPYGISIRFAKIINWPIVFLLLFITVYIGNRQIDSINNPTSLKMNVELITFIIAFLMTQNAYLVMDKTIFKKKIKKIHIKWFDKKE